MVIAVLSVIGGSVGGDMCAQCRVALHSIILFVVAYEIGKDSSFGINAAVYKKWRKYSD